MMMVPRRAFGINGRITPNVKKPNVWLHGWRVSNISTT